MKKLLINILCSFIPNKSKRKAIRMRLNNPITYKMANFAKSFSKSKHPKIKYTYGYRCANFVVTIDDKWVFKFPLTNDGHDIAIREQRITDALRPLSPFKIPKMEIIDFNGITVRKYEFVHGIGFHALSRDLQNKHADKIAKQLAKFLYIIGTSDPDEIRDLKQKPKDKPNIMYGWNQNDLWDNFILNPKTFDIVGIIDWESACFNNFQNCFTHGIGNLYIKDLLLHDYLKFYSK